MVLGSKDPFSCFHVVSWIQVAEYLKSDLLSYLLMQFATLPVKARKKGKKFAPLVDECESIGSGRSGSYDGQEDGSPTGAKERKAADVLLKYLPSAIMSGVQS